MALKYLAITNKLHSIAINRVVRQMLHKTKLTIGRKAKSTRFLPKAYNINT